jgi:hypothetical protein
VRTAGIIIVLTVAFPLETGCQSARTPTPLPATASSSAASEFEQLVRDRGSVTFRSWNGQPLRMDSDTELTFYPDHSVHMFEWGYGLSSYFGSYDVKNDGRVVTRFKEFEQGWPVMIVYREGGTFVLRPADAGNNFVMGNRGGATIPGGKGSYWPFRMLTGEDEKEVLDMIKEQGERPPK